MSDWDDYTPTYSPTPDPTEYVDLSDVCPQIQDYDQTPYSWFFITSTISLWFKIIQFGYDIYSDNQTDQIVADGYTEMGVSCSAFITCGLWPKFKRWKHFDICMKCKSILLSIWSIFGFWPQFIHDWKVLSEYDWKYGKFVCYWAIFSSSGNYKDVLNWFLICFIAWREYKKAKEDVNDTFELWIIKVDRFALRLIQVNFYLVLVWELMFYTLPICIIIAVIFVYSSYCGCGYFAKAYTTLAIKNKWIVITLYMISIGGISCLFIIFGDLFMLLRWKINLKHRLGLKKYVQSVMSSDYQTFLRFISFFRG
mmetsp:Transcript_69399/g.62263  ORF Transcript_69399/g.62263 Transcript_69399/m.62263 type:complete len:310 (-) Transcript_69399:96-1025(-)